MTRPERELRLIELLRSLGDHRVEHVVFGAVALGFYGHMRATAHLDIIVRPTEANLRRVLEWLVELDTHLATRPARRFGTRERLCSQLMRVARSESGCTASWFGWSTQLDVASTRSRLPPSTGTMLAVQRVVQPRCVMARYYLEGGATRCQDPVV